MSSTLCSSTGRLPDDATSHLQVSRQQGLVQEWQSNGEISCNSRHLSLVLYSSNGQLPDAATSHLKVLYQQGSAQCCVQQQIFMASTLQAARQCNKHLSVAQAGVSTGLVQQQRNRVQHRGFITSSRLRQGCITSRRGCATTMGQGAAAGVSKES